MQLVGLSCLWALFLTAVVHPGDAIMVPAWLSWSGSHVPKAGQGFKHASSTLLRLQLPRTPGQAALGRQPVHERTRIGIPVPRTMILTPIQTPLTVSMTQGSLYSPASAYLLQPAAPCQSSPGFYPALSVPLPSAAAPCYLCIWGRGRGSI